MDLNTEKLKVLKSKVILWGKIKTVEDKKELFKIEEKSSHISQNDTKGIFIPEAKKLNILRVAFQKSRLKCRITWLEGGDKNSKFFHHYVEHHQNINSIWSLKNVAGISLNDQNEISQVTHDHFESFYKASDKTNVRAQINIVKEYPRLFSEEEGDAVFNPISIQELKIVIIFAVRSKSPRPDG